MSSYFFCLQCKRSSIFVSFFVNVVTFFCYCCDGCYTGPIKIVRSWFGYIILLRSLLVNFKNFSWASFLFQGQYQKRNDHSIMLDKLTSLGMNRSALQWFRSYLTMRVQSVCTNGGLILSKQQPIFFGVPQGRVLRLLLFIIFINDLSLVVRGCSVELYADDTLIYFANTVKVKLS